MIILILEIVAVLLIMTGLSIIAFYLLMWWRIHHPIDDEKETYAYQLQELSNRMEELKKSIAESFMPVFTELLDRLNEPGKRL